MKTIPSYILSSLWAVAFLCFLLPFTAHVHLLFLVGFLILCGTLGYAIYLLPRDRGYHIPSSPFIYGMLAFWGVAFISVFTSEITATSFVHFGILSVLPLAFFTCLIVSAPDVFLTRAGLFAALVLGGLSLVCFLQYFIFQHLLIFGRAAWPMANPNSMAGFLALGFFGVYGFMMFVQGRRWCLAALGLSVLIIMAMFMTGSRGGLISLLIGYILMVGLSWRFYKPLWRLHLAFFVLTVAGFLIVSYAPVDDTGGALQRPAVIASHFIKKKKEYLYDRPAIWAATWEMIKDHIWTGTGIGTFRFYYPEYRSGDLSTSGKGAHNDILQFWAEMGVFAPIAFVFTLLAGLWKVIRCLQILPKENRERLKIIVPFCGFVALVLHSQITFHFYVVAILFLLGSFLAYWFRAAEKILPSVPLRITDGEPFQNFSIKALSLIVLGFFSFYMLCLQGSEVLLQRGKHSLLRKDMPAFLAYVDQSIELSFGLNGVSYALASSPLTYKLMNTGRALPLNEQMQIFYESERLLDKSLQRNPRLAHALYERAILHRYGAQYILPNLKNPERKAQFQDHLLDYIDLLEQVVAINPMIAPARYDLALIWAVKGEKDKAYQFLKNGLELPYENSNATRMYEFTAALAKEYGEEAVALRANEKLEYLKLKIEQQNAQRYKSPFLHQ